MVEVIVAMNKKGGIGFQGRLPWHIPEELKLFKQKTMGKRLIMGRTTADKLPKLPGRTILCLTRQIMNRAPFQEPCPLISTAYKRYISSLNDVGEQKDDIMIAGGAQVYKLVFGMGDLVDTVHLSVVNGEHECDTFFDRKWLDNFVITEETKYEEFTHYTLARTSCGERQYLNLLQNILENGVWREGRNGRTVSTFKNDFSFDLRNGFPLLTTKKMFLRGIVEELLFFLRGDTDSKLLEAKNINIWRGNTDRKFLDSLGMSNRREGVMGPCFITGTYTLTKEGYKPIEQVTKEDLLYTHTGQWKHILSCFEREYNGSFIELKAAYHPRIVVTPEHPFYVKKYIVKDYYKGKRRVPFFSDPEWIEAKNIDKRCVIGMKIEQDEIIPEFDNYQIKSEAEWFTFGFFLGDGWVQTEGPLRKRICFAINDKEHDIIVPKIHQVLNIQLCKTYDHCFKYRCSDMKYTKILETFGKYAWRKIIPEWVHKAPVQMIQWFLDGFCAADGCIGKNRANNNDSKRYTTVSTDIAYSVQRLYLKLGHMASISLQKRSYHKQVFGDDKPSYLHDAYSIEIYENIKRRPNYSHISDGYAWFTVSNVEEIWFPYTTKVYNFDVEDDHTYTVENLAVHNCYGYQWRFFNASYDEEHALPMENGIDQLANVVNLINNDPYSRRIFLTAYNPEQLSQCVLPPCHSIVLQFYVSDDHLDMAAYSRSSDMFLGIPFNIASYALFLMVIAKITNKIPRMLYITMGDTHIYEAHCDAVREQIERMPYAFPTLEIPDIKELSDIDTLQASDFKLVGYKSHPSIKAEMVA